MRVGACPSVGLLVGLEARWPNIRLVRRTNMPYNAKDKKRQSRKINKQRAKNGKPQTTPTTPTTSRTPRTLRLLRPLLVPHCALCLLAPDKKYSVQRSPRVCRAYCAALGVPRSEDRAGRHAATKRRYQPLLVRDRGFGRFAKAADFFHSAVRHRVHRARRRRLSVREGSAPCACPLRRHRARHRSHQSRRRSRRCARRSRPRRRPRCCPCLRPRLHPRRRYGVVASEATAKRRRNAHAASHVPSDTAREHDTSTPVLVRPRGRAPTSKSGVREHTPPFRCSSRTARTRTKIKNAKITTKAAWVGRNRLH